MYSEVPKPLADLLRPDTLDDVVGQEHVLAAGKLLHRLHNDKSVVSLIFWGPPGVGKTTLARILANNAKANVVELSAVTAGVADVKKAVTVAENNRLLGSRTVLILDEIHRFNKAQQDALLPHVENGLLTLIGATTENPSFSVNSALLSRCRVVTLEGLDSEKMELILGRAVRFHNVLLPKKQQVKWGRGALAWLSGVAAGDARTSLNILETAQGNRI